MLFTWLLLNTFPYICKLLFTKDFFRMNKLYFVIVCILSIPVVTVAQDTRLAEQYYQDGEYEKAGILFQKLLDQSKANTHFFNRLTDCLVYQDKIDDAESLVKKQLKSFPDESANYVVYGLSLIHIYTGSQNRNTENTIK